MIWLLACVPPLVAPEVVEDPGHDWDLDGQTERQGDCDDASASVGQGFVEVCDGLDNDCDGRVDEDDASDAVVWFQDLDEDGFGFGERAACAVPQGFVGAGGDCDDQDAAIHPDAAEVCDQVDNDCDGEVDGGSADAATFYADADGDGYGDSAVSELACQASEGFVDNAADCDDTSTAAWPGHPEICGDGLDNDCSGTASAVCLDDDLAGAQWIAGTAGGENLGQAVYGPGDRDGDGLPDLLIASPGRDTTDQQSGALELFLGPVADGTVVDDASWTLAGVSKNAEFGTRLAHSSTALWVGAPGHQADIDKDEIGTNVGAAYLVEGTPGATDVSEAAVAWVVGSAQGDRLGSAVALVDGQPAVGVPGAAWSDDEPGVVLIFEETLGELDPDAAATIWGEGQASYTGVALLGADVDGDGLSDMAIGAPGRKTWGSVYVHHAPFSDALASDGVEWEGPEGGDYGSALAAWDAQGDGLVDVVVGAPGTGEIYVGGELLLAESEVGHVLAAAPDVDGDGFDELLVGGDGRAWVVFGGPDPELGPELAWDEGGDLGAALAGLGDLDGDGHADLAIGAPGHGAGEEGVVLLLRGASDWRP
ncbi:MAG: hypothetical protein GY913_04795 [Proteobacteria bacterium]|nr:hypothetical protein [Pseudomonadota bacterium]MCP4916219.1 hypothetical protein [Pseudomonadota bacterium]